MEDEKKTKEECKEGNKEIDHYERIVNRAHREIEQVHNTYRLLMSLLTIIFVLGISIAAVVSWKTVGGMNDTINGTIQHINSRLDREVDIVQRQIKSRIDEEFKQDNISDLVEEKAKKTVEKKVESYLSATTKLIEEKVAGFEKESQMMTSSLDKLNERAELLFSIILANNDNMSALEDLKKLANDKNYTYFAEAQKAYDKIVKLLNSPIRLVRSIKWNEGIEPSKFALKDLIGIYHREGERNGIKSQLIKYIWERGDFEEKEKMVFLISVIKNDTSIEAIRTAGENFIKATNLSIYPLEKDKIVKWWEENREKYNESPVDQPTDSND